MESAPAKQRLSGMIPVARFYSDEEAAEFCKLAADTGVLAVMADLKRLPQLFDASLGGFDASESRSVYASPDDVPKLCKALEEALTVDPQDPLCALSNAELRGILQAPLKANLTEWALAKKLLTTRGANEDRERTEEEKRDWALDPHAASDIRLARWLGIVVLASFGTGLALAAFAMSGGVDYEAAENALRRSMEQEYSTAVTPDRFSEPLKVLIPAVLTFVSSLVLTFSWRIFDNGAWRWMFPRGWRAVGIGALALTAAGIVAGILAGYFRR
jgi:hypothetical protein